MAKWAKTIRCRAAFLVVVLVVGCGTEPTDRPRPPGESVDAGGDGGPDAGTQDASDGGADAGEPDAGVDSELRVEVETGWLEGRRQDEAIAFLGVPYAAPPVEDLRWRPPQAPKSWSGVQLATAMSGECVQPVDSGSRDTKGTEDCLYLNAWTPDPAGRAPVMVFLHGGGNFRGSTSEPLGDATAVDSDAPLYDGARLAGRGGVVVVTLNYRLGALGFLSSPDLDAELGRTSGNFGLLDQIAALQWVQRNIPAFGGDPDRVLLFGQSGGGRDVNLLLTSSLTEGLFSAVAIHSAPLGAAQAQPLRERAQALAAEVGCADALDRLACLRAVDAHRLVGAEASRPLGLASAAFLPIVDGTVVEDQPRNRVAAGLVQDVPILLGTTAAEYSHRWAEVTPATYAGWVRAFVSPRQVQPALEHYRLDRFATAHEAFVTLMSDRNVTCPHRSYARAIARAGYDGWLYRFDQTLPAEARLGFGPYHTSDLVYLFQHLDDPQLEGTDEDRSTQEAMMQLWTAFAATGQPALADGPEWAPFDVATEPSLRIGPQPRPESFLKQEDCDFWDGLY
jgi:para-nitrobenzyl esterase